MPLSRVVASVVVALVAVAMAQARSGDCPREWTPGWTRAGLDRAVRALTTFDLDGPGPAGPALIVAGDFYSFNGVAAPSPIAWDGERLTTLRTGLRTASVRTFAAIDLDGPGPMPAELYAGGSFMLDAGLFPVGVVRWTLGTGGMPDRWVPLGASTSGGLSSVIGLVAHDFDGPGPNPARLVALSEGNPTNGLIQQWTGTAWTAVGTNNRMTATRSIASVDHDDDGPGAPVLYIAVGNSAPMRFNGSMWVPVSGLSQTVESVVAFDLDGDGPQRQRLVAAGSRSFTVSGRECTAASYDGAAWSATGFSLGFTNAPNTLRVVPGPNPGSHPALILSLANTGPRLYRWNNTGLSDGGPIGGWGVIAGTATPSGSGGVAGLAFYDPDGPGPTPAQTIVGGDFRLTSGDGPVAYLASVSGTTWRPLGRFSAVPDGTVLALKAWDLDGDGPQPQKLFVGGGFSTVRGVAIPALATWDGREWTASGNFAAASPTAVRIGAMTTFDDDGPGPRPPGLYVGGYFDTLNGSPVGHVARLDATGWSPLGTGLANLVVSGGTFGVSAMLPVDLDGPGPQGESLVVASGFSQVNGMANGKIAAWNGAMWTPMGVGAPDEVLGLAALPRAGEGPLLLAVNYRGTLSTWNGTNWQHVPSFFSVASSFVYFARMIDDDGDGPLPPYFLVGGAFDAVGGTPVPQGLARFDGQAWSSVTLTDNFSRTETAATLDLDGSGPEPARVILAGSYSNTTGGTQSIAVRNLGAGGSVGYDFIGGYTFTGGINAIELFADEPGRLPSIYIGGGFSGVGLINVAGGVPTGGLARFGCTPCIAFADQPLGRTVRAGGSIVLEATPMIDGFGATYQWRRDGAPLSDGGGISGSATTMLSLAGAGSADAGLYDLLVTASCGSTLSAAATVSVACDADFNADGLLSIDDVFGFIQAFLANQTAADFTRDWRVGMQDLFDFLSAYLAGC